MLFTKLLVLAAAGAVVANPLAVLDERAGCSKLKGPCGPGLPCCKPKIHFCNANARCVKIPNPKLPPGKSHPPGQTPPGKSDSPYYPYAGSPQYQGPGTSPAFPANDPPDPPEPPPILGSPNYY